LQIDPEEFRRRYAELSDDGLLAIDRQDLTEVAQQYFDAEVRQRGLHSEQGEEPESTTDEELVPVATFSSEEEANLGRGLLRSAEIPCYLESEMTSSWAGLGGLRLMVPASFFEQAEEVLHAEISDEELLAQAESEDGQDEDQD
jgi:Putative prokaryotic signal transducing protein